jgi:TolB protein
MPVPSFTQTCLDKAVLLSAAATVAVGLLLATSPPADASFPGANGWIAFTSLVDEPGNLSDEIFLTREDGSEVVRLTNGAMNERSAAVSPNGKEIAFSRAAPGVSVNLNTTEIYVMDTSDDDGDGNGDHLRRLTDNAFTDDNVAWSPGGKKIAFRTNRDGNDEIYVIDADDQDGNGDPINLTNHPAADQQPVFSPDGSKIAFASNRGGNFSIYEMNADGSGAPTKLTTDPAPAAWPEYSPDGTRLAFGSARLGTDIDIWVMNAAPEGPLNVATNLTDAMPTNERWPAWSPDRQKIAFWSGIGNGLGSDADIYVINADGSGAPANVSNTQLGAAWPDWGPAPTKPN